MNFLVTGGAGFIGSHLTDRLISHGHAVTVVDDLSIGDSRYVNQKAMLRPMDIACASFVRSFDREQFHGIFHFGAVSRTVPAIEDPVRCARVNVQGTINVLELARRLEVPRVVVSSSNVVYAADTPYKASKKAMEEFCAAYNCMYGVSLCVLRYSNVYGPRLRKGDPAVFAQLRDCKDEHGYIEITGDGTQSRDFTHVDDIVEGNLLAWCRMNVEAPFGIDLCTGHNTTLNEVAKFFDCPVKYIAARPGDIAHIIQSPAMASSALGWKARICLEDGISSIWTY